MCIHVRKTLFWNIHSNIPTEKKLQLLQLLKKMHVQCMLQNWTMCLALGSQTFIGKHEKESDVKDLFGSFCKTCLNVYERAISAIWIIHKKYQILIVFWLCEWKIVLIQVKPSGLHMCVLEHLLNGQVEDFSRFFRDFDSASIEYLLVQI